MTEDSGLGATIAQLVERAHSTYESKTPPDPLLFGRMRLFCSQDVDEIVAHGGTFSIIHPMSFTHGHPFRIEREEFDERLRRLQEYTRKAAENGITVIAYVSQNVSTSREADPAGWIMSEVWRDQGWWDRYADFYGPRPEEEPSEWLQRGADGVYGGHVWIPPEAPDERHYEVRGCPHSPAFRQYMAGIINILLEAGIRGIYLDHSELMQAHSTASIRCFRDFLASRYTADELKQRFGIEELARAYPAADRNGALWPETVLFQGASEAEFHRYLRDHARKRDPDFIIAGNLWGGFGFQSAALNGSDIQLAGMVDTFLYSELATGTESPERGQRNTPGTRDGVRTSIAPLIRVLAASSRTHAATSYTYYPQTPNPVPTEGALFNIQRLAMAEAFANHTVFRRVEARHTEPVHRAAKTIYDLLKRVEPDLVGAEMASDIAVVASLQPCYYGRYSYHLEVSRTLADAGIAHEMLAPRDLRPEKLAQYHAVVLPNTAVLGEQAYAALVDYAADGGTAIAFGEVGVLDLRGGPGPAAGPARTARFTDVPVDPQTVERDNATVDREPDDARHARWARGEWSEQLKPTMNRVVAAVETAAGDALTARRHGDSSVEISAMRRPGSNDLILHAVNYAVDLAGRATPAAKVRMSAALNGRSVDRAEWHALDGIAQALDVRTSGARAAFTVPEVGVYGIAIIRFRSG
jgi:hypothetical protein